MFDWFRLIVLAGSVVVAACGGSDDDPARPPQPSGRLTEVAAASSFKAPVAAADTAVSQPAQVTTVQSNAFTVNNVLQLTDRRGRSAGLAATEVIAANGVCHAIGKVILPAT